MSYIYTSSYHPGCRMTILTPMAGRDHLQQPARKQEKSRSSSPSHIFIQQNPSSYPRGGSKIVSSQARRFQSAGKRRRQEVLAHQGAEYARSLVGWRSASSTPVSNEESPASGSASSSAVHRQLSLLNRVPASQNSISTLAIRNSPGQEETTPNEGDVARLTMAVGGGLRIDPFNAFPTSNSRTVMLMVDYRKFTSPFCCPSVFADPTTHRYPCMGPTCLDSLIPAWVTTLNWTSAGRSPCKMKCFSMRPSPSVVQHG